MDLLQKRFLLIKPGNVCKFLHVVRGVTVDNAAIIRHLAAVSSISIRFLVLGVF